MAQRDPKPTLSLWAARGRFMPGRSVLALGSLLALLCTACGVDRPPVGTFDAVLVESQAALSTAPGAADESGGGMFLTADGEPARLRMDGSRAQLVAHPGNAAALGKVSALRPLGPHSALVSAEGGLFVAQGGWIIAPSWRAHLPVDGLVATATGADGTAWIAHQQGLFRVSNGELSELKLDGASVEGLTALAAAPAEDGANGIWFAQGDLLRVGVQLTRENFTVRTSSREVKGIVSLVSLTPSSTARGELWVVTQKTLHRRSGEGWFTYDLGGTLDQVMSAGRVLWVRVGARLLRYEADSVSATVQASSDPLATGKWEQAAGVPGETPVLLGVDASGSAWVQSGDASYCVSRGRIPRLFGLDDAMRISTDEVVVQARFPPGPEPLAVIYRLQDGEEVNANAPAFSLGGEESDGRLRAFSLAGLPAGLYTLGATATYMDGTRARRTLTFEYRPGSNEVLSFEKDIQPIHVARCQKCHQSGPGRPLTNLDAWTANAQLILGAVKDQRMPADGPLDPALSLKIQRWVSGGMKP